MLKAIILHKKRRKKSFSGYFLLRFMVFPHSGLRFSANFFLSMKCQKCPIFAQYIKQMKLYFFLCPYGQKSIENLF